MLAIAPYLSQHPHWPPSGRHILAHHDETSIVVYQAFRPSIAEEATRLQRFGAGFSRARMSWIKPGFLWMMFRSGWATKPDQERVLAVRVPRTFFERLLAQAVASSFTPEVFGSREAWADAVARSSVRLQWDPDHGPSGAPLERRALQLGLRGDVLAEYADSAALGIDDVTDFVAAQRPHASPPYADLCTPVEHVFVPEDAEAAGRVGLEDGPHTSSRVLLEAGQLDGLAPENSARVCSAPMLTPFADDLWIEAREAKFLGIETGTRMTVVRLSGGGLFVHSPVALDDATRRAIGELGEVRAVVAPSVFHHLFVGEWMRAYPGALFAACPGLEWKRPDLAFGLVLADQPHEAWARDLDQVYFSARRENEVVFFHRKSRTMICSDALLNLSKHPSAATRLVARLTGNRAPGTGWPERLMIRDRRLARRQADRILAWDIDRIVLAHGHVVERDGRETVRRAYAWL